MCVLEYRRTAIAMNKPPKSGLAFDADFEHPTCKGKSFNPSCCYSCLIADLAVLKWNTVCIFCSMIVPCLNAFALSGRHYISSCEPRVSLRLPWAMCSIGPSARPCYIRKLSINSTRTCVRCNANGTKHICFSLFSLAALSRAMPLLAHHVNSARVVLHRMWPCYELHS